MELQGEFRNLLGNSDSEVVEMILAQSGIYCVIASLGGWRFQIFENATPECALTTLQKFRKIQSRGMFPRVVPRSVHRACAAGARVHVQQVQTCMCSRSTCACAAGADVHLQQVHMCMCSRCTCACAYSGHYNRVVGTGSNRKTASGTK